MSLLLPAICEVEKQLCEINARIEKCEEFSRQHFSRMNIPLNLHPLTLIKRLQLLETKISSYSSRQLKVENDKKQLACLSELCLKKHLELCKSYSIPFPVALEKALDDFKGASHTSIGGALSIEKPTISGTIVDDPPILSDSRTTSTYSCVMKSAIVHPSEKSAVDSLSVDCRNVTITNNQGNSSLETSSKTEILLMKSNSSTMSPHDGQNIHRGMNPVKNIDRVAAKSFVPITEAEFLSVSDIVRGRVKLEEVNQVYKVLFSYFKDSSDSISEPLSIANLSKLGVKVVGATGEAKLKVLRSLKLLSMDRHGVLLV